MVQSWMRTLYGLPHFTRSYPAVGAGDVIRWWEGRRLFYNLAVGCAGIATCVLLILCAVIAESTVGEAIGMPDGPLLGVLAIILYAVFANICYTGGWVAELLVRSSAGADGAAKFGIRAFRIGVTFSILLTLSPAVVCWLAFAVAFFTGQKHGPLGE